MEKEGNKGKRKIQWEKGKKEKKKREEKGKKGKRKKMEKKGKKGKKGKRKEEKGTRKKERGRRKKEEEGRRKKEEEEERKKKKGKKKEREKDREKNTATYRDPIGNGPDPLVDWAESFDLLKNPQAKRYLGKTTCAAPKSGKGTGTNRSASGNPRRKEEAMRQQEVSHSTTFRIRETISNAKKNSSELPTKIRGSQRCEVRCLRQ